METYAIALSYAIPGFIVLIIIESIIAHARGMRVNNGMDTISSLSSGMTNTLKSLLGLGIVIVSYAWMEEHFGVFEIKSTVWLYLLAFIGLDFAGYWSHRFNHVINIFWNRHIVHHSSEEFNLACALRQEISAIVGVYFFLYIPMAIIGIPPEVIAITAPIHLFAQFWYHTRLIDRMGFLEHIIVTPSHHRVHHAINPEYIDRNYSQIFIVWDKWFGTFQEELPDVPPVYGTKKPARTWNPFLINFQHAWGILVDAWRTRNWWDKLRIWFMPTGWRPDDVKEKYPVFVIKDVFRQEKYNPPASSQLLYWSWAQLFFNLVFMYDMLIRIAELSFEQLIIYSIFQAVSIFSFTALMDRHVIAVPSELIRLGMGIYIWLGLGGWFGLENTLVLAPALIIGYLLTSTAATIYFTWFEERVAENL